MDRFMFTNDRFRRLLAILPELKGAKLNVMVALIYLGKEKGYCEISAEELSDITGYNPATTRTTITELENLVIDNNKRVLEVIRNTKNNKIMSNGYRPFPDGDISDSEQTIN